MYTERLQTFTLWIEKGLNKVFSQKYNPFYYHGALPNFFIWTLFISGLLLFAYYVPTMTKAYPSVKYITEQIPFGNAFRSIHRYAADGMMIFVLLHMLRVWFTDRYREYRIIPWLTGVILLTITFLVGLTGYLLIWDQEAVNLTSMTVNLLGALPLVGAGLAEFFMPGGKMVDFTLTRLLFLHLAIPGLLMFFLWMHYLRITRPVTDAPAPLYLLLLGGLFMICGFFPVELGADPNRAAFSQSISFDLLYMWPQWLAVKGWDAGWVWALTLGVIVALLWLPYLHKKTLRGQFAHVKFENCTGCSLCYHDCPYEAIEMVDRDDDTRFKRLAVVDAGRCSNCGLCVGACAFKAIEIPRRESADVLEEIKVALATTSS
ncbi:MAG: cytochrome b N-terminal domain-containing protein [Vampirovibrio sp.]|nr:cytochrome b N-terminal domain-containing protein [Vampirovibrio sp.]